VTHHYTAKIVFNGRGLGWTVWLFSNFTGDRKDYLGSARTKQGAEKIARDYNFINGV
jgi:hypothetical protein